MKEPLAGHIEKEKRDKAYESGICNVALNVHREADTRWRSRQQSFPAAVYARYAPRYLSESKL